MSSATGTLVHTLGHNWLGKADIAVQTILLATVFVVVGLRLWSRHLLRISQQRNDWLIVAATILMLSRYVVELLLVLLCGMGTHADEVSRVGGSKAFIRFDELTYAGDLIWLTVVAIVQLSILHYYLQKFQQPAIMWLTYIVIGLCSALWMAGLLATAFLCDPPRKIWLTRVEGHCGDRKLLHTGCAVTQLILNTFILLLPTPIIRNMQFPRSRKLGLGGIYLLGLIFLSPSIIALFAVRIKIEFILDPGDPTYGSARKSLLSNVVALLGIIVACLPVLAPVHRMTARSNECTMMTEGPSAEPVSTRYWKATVLSGGHMEEPDIPLVTVTQPPIARKFNEWALGQIKITSDWEIHSTRNSARLERDSIRRG
ncbi:hypothetical protein N7532_000643 [Penicillium argentinense]|uniref:Rhodopsin domain-containing protein n=1 Tax=Penicillium argentinense TaxID=1131581 RepID=A0A9W9G5R6_9EURO|nr:uncharacterized protein N7532_000643 [Penicillium argentinense]KAJ5112598.1 hypothetical protein N7532_000643 [Penicillium argentinense]